MKITNMPKIIYLCGFMGAGKSSIGKHLAQKLDLEFTDLDKLIEEAAEKTIPQIFEEEGEEAFRVLERKCLLEAIRSYTGVLSLGGGTLQNQHLVDHIKINGLLIFIETPFSVIFERVSRNKNRPLLLDEDGTIKEKSVLEKELKQLYQSRLQYYQQAEITIQTDKESSIEDNTAALVRKIRNHVSYR